MRKLTDKYKLSVRSVREVFILLHEMDGYVVYDPTLEYLNEGAPEPATRAAIVTALLLQIGTWPAEQQKQFLADGLATLNGLLAEDTPSFPMGGQATKQTPPTRPVTVRDETKPDEPRNPKRRKNG